MASQSSTLRAARVTETSAVGYSVQGSLTKTRKSMNIRSSASLIQYMSQIELPLRLISSTSAARRSKEPSRIKLKQGSGSRRGCDHEISSGLRLRGRV